MTNLLPGRVQKNTGALMAGMIAMGLIGCAKEEQPVAVNTPIQRQAMELAKKVAVLESTKDPAEMERLALALAKSEEPESLNALIAFLKDPEHLAVLDPKPQDNNEFKLRLFPLLQALAQLPPDQANASMVALAEPIFTNKSNNRHLAYIQACAEIKQPSSALLKILDAQVSPIGCTNTVIATLIKMRSPAACDLLEKYSRGKYFSDGWFTHKLLLVRDDPAIVAFYEKLLRSDMHPDSLRNIIVQTLFDYRPEEWYDQNKPRLYVPPPRPEASTEVLENLQKIADYCLTLKVTDKTMESIRKGQKEIDQILEFRRNHAPKIPQLINDLGSEKFQVRDRATRELVGFGELVEPILRKAVQGDLSFETRQRLEQILGKIKK